MLPDVPRETKARLRDFADLVKGEAERQNLVAKSTLAEFWTRHVLDSVQLAPLSAGRFWLDIGSGAGLPGLVLAIVRADLKMTLVEPRTLRADFLKRCVDHLGLHDRVEVARARIEAIPPKVMQTISARAVASIDKLFAMAAPFADDQTVWVLPKGRSAAAELAVAREAWQGSFELVPSITDSEARIVVARHVRPRGRR